MPSLHAFREPKGDFLVSRVHTVRSMAQISSHFKTEVASNSSWRRIRRASSSEHFSALTHSIRSLPHHRDNYHKNIRGDNKERLGRNYLVLRSYTQSTLERRISLTVSYNVSQDAHGLVATSSRQQVESPVPKIEETHA